MVFFFIARNVLMSYKKDTPLLRESKRQVEKYTESLSSIISNDLSNILLTKLQFQRLVNWLLRLGKGEEVKTKEKKKKEGRKYVVCIILIESWIFF